METPSPTGNDGEHRIIRGRSFAEVEPVSGPQKSTNQDYPPALKVAT